MSQNETIKFIDTKYKTDVLAGKNAYIAAVPDCSSMYEPRCID